MVVATNQLTYSRDQVHLDTAQDRQLLRAAAFRRVVPTRRSFSKQTTKSDRPASETVERTVAQENAAS